MGRYDFSNAGDLDNQQSILQDIVIGIGNADVIIADVTGLNPNVFYELGLCHALDKKVILITQDISELPFDIRSYRVDEYTTNASVSIRIAMFRIADEDFSILETVYKKYHE